MKTNVGSYDAGIRFLAGCGALFMTVNGWGWWGLLGLIPILSGVFGVCLIYRLLGIDTNAWEECRENRAIRERLAAHRAERMEAREYHVMNR